MKRLLISTALVATTAAATSFGAFAQSASTAPSDTSAPAATTAPAAPAASADGSAGFMTTAAPGEIKASTLIGKDVYTTEGTKPEMSADGVQKSWKDIGEIGDVLINKDGKVDAVLVDIGGFLGIGEHRVALSMSGLTMVSDTSTKDNTRDFFVVVDQSKDALKAAPEFQMDQQADASSTMDTKSGTTTGMTADSSTTASGAAATGTGTMVGNAANKAGDAMNTAANKVGAAATAVGEKASKTVDNMTASKDAAKTPAQQGYTKVTEADITAKDLKDAPVYGADNKKIGDISKLVMTADGKLDKAVVNVGGFLGIGGKSVAISSDQMQVMKKDKSDDLRVYVAMSEDQLKAMPDYSKG